MLYLVILRGGISHGSNNLGAVINSFFYINLTFIVKAPYFVPTNKIKMLPIPALLPFVTRGYQTKGSRSHWNEMTFVPWKQSFVLYIQWNSAHLGGAGIDCTYVWHFTCSLETVNLRESKAKEAQTIRKNNQWQIFYHLPSNMIPVPVGIHMY